MKIKSRDQQLQKKNKLLSYTRRIVMKMKSQLLLIQTHSYKTLNQSKMKITKGLLTKSRKKCKFIKLKKVASINLHGQMTEEVSEKL